jgi:adenine deaminase
VGSAAPGKRADLCLVDGTLEEFVISDVIARGQVVVADGSYVGPTVIPEYPAAARASVKLSALPTRANFRIPANSTTSARVRVIEVHDGSLITNELQIDLPVRAGAYWADPARGSARSRRSSGTVRPG